MALRKTFGEIVEATRNEARLSSNTSRGIDHLDHIREIVKRNYYTLCEDFDWQHLQLNRDAGAANRVVLEAGSRYYDFPSDLNPMKIEGAFVKWGSVWLSLDPGIGYANYTLYDPAKNQRCDPVRRWDYYGGAQFEVWPLPATTGESGVSNEVAWVGQKIPEQVVDDESRLDMDNLLLQLAAAAELLAENDSKAAQGKAGLAAARFLTVRGNMSGKARYAMGRGRILDGPGLFPRHPRYIFRSG